MIKAKHLPNIITFIRIGFIPAIMWLLLQGSDFQATFLALFFVLLDGLDGYLARKINAVTKFGRFLDAAADSSLLAFFTFTIYLIDYITLTIFLLLILQRLIRYSLEFFFIINKTKPQNPMHLKYNGISVMVLTFLIPVVRNYLGHSQTIQIATTLIWISIVAVTIQVWLAARKFKLI